VCGGKRFLTRPHLEGGALPSPVELWKADKGVDNSSYGRQSEGKKGASLTAGKGLRELLRPCITRHAAKEEGGGEARIAGKPLRFRVR